MPVLDKIIVSDFRNIRFAELSFRGSINCLCGENGQGKTNMLDAIYYLSMTKSFLGTPDQMCRRWDAESFSIAGTFAMQDGTRSKFVVTCADNSKTVRRDEKLCPRISSHIGLLPVVTVSPSDVSMVSESGEERRRFFNSVLSQMDSKYLSELQKYNRLLGQRNKILKDASPDESLLDVIDLQMGECAQYISNRRSDFVAQLCPEVEKYCKQLSGGREEVGIEYKSDSIAAQGGLAAVLRESRKKDMYLKFTGAGVQRDDFLFTMNGHPIRRCGSQGQQKSFLVALKLSQYDVMKRAYGFPPMLLLDDVFDKLDVGRISNLIQMVSNNDFGQIFISDTNYDRLHSVISGICPEALYFRVTDGEFALMGED